MDEYVQFNSLSYLKPLFKYNTYNDGYDQYVIYILNHFKYRMSYAYIGNTSSVLYYPFYKLLPYNISNTVYSILFWGLFCWLFKKAGQYSWNSTLILLCFFPLVMQVLHDGGPIKVALLAYPLTAILFRKIVTAIGANKKILFSVLLGLLWFIALEDKVFFVYLFPGVLLFAVALLPDEHLSVTILKENLKYLMVSLALFAALGAVLLFSTVKETAGNTSFYITSVIGANKVLLPNLTTALKERWYVFLAFFRYLDFPYYANRNVFMAYNSVRFWLCVTAGGIVVVVLLKYRKIGASIENAQRSRQILLLLSLLSLVVTFVLFGGTRLGHHYVFIWVPILAMVFSVERTKPVVYKRIDNLFLFYSMASLLLVVFSKPIINNSPDLSGEIYHDLDSLNSRGGYIINYSSWNGYFIRELDPRKQEIVTFLIRADRNIKNESARLTAFSKGHHMPVINVSEYPDTQDSVRKLFPAVKSMQHLNLQTHLHDIDILYF